MEFVHGSTGHAKRIHRRADRKPASGGVGVLALALIISACTGDPEPFARVRGAAF